ncbi:hypothetical protein [Demequina oxidasica]|uniref:hypothetical protein n=1 Tax=Demequina oxidasica TaxID=676199 RepID=UPI000AE8FA97|nr:hypothetical protein [Demequina oxidasica]
MSDGEDGLHSDAASRDVETPPRSRNRSTKPRRRWPWIVVILILLGLLATSITMTYEASVRSNEWSAQVAEITDTSYTLGKQVADEKSENVRLNDNIDLLEEQLSNSKDTVLQLSDQKAQWRDDTEFAQQQVEATENLVTRAASAANGLQRCADGQQELAATLASDEEYTPEEITDYQDSVRELCDNAEKANSDLQEELAQ